LVLMVPQENVEPLDHQESLERLDLPDQLEKLEHQDVMEKQEKMDSVVTMVTQEHKVFEDPLEPMDLTVLEDHLD